MPLHEKIMAGISRKTGLSAEEIRNTSPGKLRDYLTGKINKPFKVTSVFPVIGRGNVLREGVKSTYEINRETDKILGV